MILCEIEIISMSRTWIRANDLPNTGRALYPLERQRGHILWHIQIPKVKLSDIVMKNNSIGMKFKKGVGTDHSFHCLSLHWKVFPNYDHSSNHKVKGTYTVFTEIYSVSHFLDLEKGNKGIKRLLIGINQFETHLLLNRYTFFLFLWFCFQLFYSSACQVDPCSFCPGLSIKSKNQILNFFLLKACCNSTSHCCGWCHHYSL